MSSPDNKHDYKHDNKMHEAYCVCTQSNGLFVPNRHLSHMVAAAMLGLFFVFLAGFFCGKQHEIKHFLYSVDEDTFSDQISSALYGVSLADLADFEGVESAENPGSGDAEAHMGDNSGGYGVGEEAGEGGIQDGRDNNTELTGSNSNAPLALDGEKDKKKADDKSGGEHQKQYYAQLIGFGTAQAADSFARRLTKQGFSVKVEQCKSRTARGRVVTWYQVVTQPYSDAQALQDVVDVLAHTEKLKGVRVKKC